MYVLDTSPPSPLTFFPKFAKSRQIIAVAQPTTWPEVPNYIYIGRVYAAPKNPDQYFLECYPPGSSLVLSESESESEPDLIATNVSIFRRSYALGKPADHPYSRNKLRFEPAHLSLPDAPLNAWLLR